MARLNIEDDLHKDNRFINLIIKFGCRKKALGALVEAWMLAQQHYLDEANDRLIPLKNWESQDIANELIEVGLAVRHANGIKMVGSDKQFAWLLQRQIAGKKDKKKRKASSKRPLPSDERPLTTDHRLESSYSYSSSNSFSKSESISPTAHPSGDELPPLARVWNEHCGNLPRVKACSAQRIRKSQALWKLHPGEDYWIKVIGILARSKFCTGDNDRGWVATFDFLLQPDTHNKALEGKYSSQFERSVLAGPKEKTEFDLQLERDEEEIRRLRNPGGF